MAAITYELAPIEIDRHKNEQGTIPTAEARSSLLRNLDGNLAVRNRREVKELPREVPEELDELLYFVESRGFDDIEKRAHRYLRKQYMNKSAGSMTVGGDIGDWESLPVSGRLDNAVVVAAVSSLALERFDTIECRLIYNLDEVDISRGLSEESTERSRGLMRVIASAIEDVDELGLTLAQSEAAKALGVSVDNDRPTTYVV